jgi:DNA-binding FadR family transcriptional regulator
MSAPRKPQSRELLVELDLAREFGVSHGPIREAIRILRRRRLVNVRPRRGAYIRTLVADPPAATRGMTRKPFSAASMAAANTPDRGLLPISLLSVHTTSITLRELRRIRASSAEY